jgi:hypothetical protein
MPFKLIRLGDRSPLLFDVTEVDGETAARNLAERHPDVVERLDEHLAAWAAELVPPGFSPGGVDRYHETLFAEHQLTTADKREDRGLKKAKEKP